ncbi:hypothetical protein G5B40_03330 [Pikeienuella piscinae]|uniref:Uncharacterized protein n=1 Tax=Pikeienuella piscinae TaxID=2748098 RepID=A0A7L5BTV0_9RHOB|nr:hypothetical protein [Pikeienuella piscinae]QIE54551.1 hypothetical protein G5B40_03330 [Pikeienuella piscinae]
MRAMTIAVAVIGGLAFATAASACPFSSKSKEQSAEAPILSPSSES